MIGVVRKLMTEKGFGFIRPEGRETSRDDYFFHRMDCAKGLYDELVENDRVQFEPSETPKGLRAVAVERL